MRAFRKERGLLIIGVSILVGQPAASIAQSEHEPPETASEESRPQIIERLEIARVRRDAVPDAELVVRNQRNEPTDADTSRDDVLYVRAQPTVTNPIRLRRSLLRYGSKEPEILSDGNTVEIRNAGIPLTDPVKLTPSWAKLARIEQPVSRPKLSPDDVEHAVASRLKGLFWIADTGFDIDWALVRAAARTKFGQNFRYRQTVDGVPVIGADAYVFVDSSFAIDTLRAQPLSEQDIERLKEISLIGYEHDLDQSLEMVQMEEGSHEFDGPEEDTDMPDLKRAMYVTSELLYEVFDWAEMNTGLQIAEYRPELIKRPDGLVAGWRLIMHAEQFSRAPTEQTQKEEQPQHVELFVDTNGQVLSKRLISSAQSKRFFPAAASVNTVTTASLPVLMMAGQQTLEAAFDLGNKTERADVTCDDDACYLWWQGTDDDAEGSAPSVRVVDDDGKMYKSDLGGLDPSFEEVSDIPAYHAYWWLIKFSKALRDYFAICPSDQSCDEITAHVLGKNAEQGGSRFEPSNTLYDAGEIYLGWSGDGDEAISNGIDPYIIAHELMHGYIRKTMQVVDPLTCNGNTADENEFAALEESLADVLAYLLVELVAPDFQADYQANDYEVGFISLSPRHRSFANPAKSLEITDSQWNEVHPDAFQPEQFVETDGGADRLNTEAWLAAGAPQPEHYSSRLAVGCRPGADPKYVNMGIPNKFAYFLLSRQLPDPPVIVDADLAEEGREKARSKQGWNQLVLDKLAFIIQTRLGCQREGVANEASCHNFCKFADDTIREIDPHSPSIKEWIRSIWWAIGVDLDRIGRGCTIASDDGGSTP